MIKIARAAKIKISVLLLIALIVGYAALAISFRSPQPFSGIASNSMAPNLHRGDLILTKSVAPEDIKEGDIIVFRVPGEYQRQYNYPNSIAHRVVRVEKDSGAGIVFWTKGDNTEADPFGVTTDTLEGRMEYKAPYAGYVLLFFKSRNGLIFIVSAVLLIAAYYLSEAFGARIKRILSGAPSPEIVKHFEETEAQNAQVASALNAFSKAMEEYAEHLSSHTAVVKEMAEAAKELKEVVKELRENKKS